MQIQTRQSLLALTAIGLLPVTLGAQSPQTAKAANTAAMVSPDFSASAPLSSRVGPPPPAILKLFAGASGVSPHTLTDEERSTVAKTLELLPSFSRQALQQHVRSISFMDGMAANGTTVIEESSTLPIFNIVLRSSLLQENTSEFLTRKERSNYLPATSGISVTVEAGSLPALLYVLLHESVHVVDNTHRHGKEGTPYLYADNSALTQGVWNSERVTVPAYRSPLFANDRFHTGKPVSIDTAAETYCALAQTPFVSLYANSNWYDDVAELVTCYYLTQTLHQPYRIVVRNNESVLYSLEPMTAEPVTSRFSALRPLFSEQKLLSR